MRASKTATGGLALSATVGALLLAAGAARAESRIADLAPANAAAEALGPLSAYLDGNGRGTGTIWVKLPRGEVLKGQYRVNVGGSLGRLGREYSLSAPGGAYDTSYSMSKASPVTVDMVGPSGVTAQCEFMNDDALWHGSGVCRFSNGADYRVRY